MRRVCVVKCNIGGGGESTMFATQSVRFICGALFGKVQCVVEHRRRREGTFYSARPPSGPAAGETGRRRLHAFDLLCHLVLLHMEAESDEVAEEVSVSEKVVI